MDILLVFIAIAVSITLTTEQVKRTWKMFKNIASAVKEKTGIIDAVEFGLIVAQVLGFWAVFTFSIGIISTLGIEYTDMGFKYFDLFTTSLIVSGGASVVYTWYEKARKNPDEK